jgi:FkbM family methyltransferase
MSSHKNRISALKDRGFRPKIILDIGANEGQWTNEIKEVFPGSEFVMFEANDINENALKSVGKKYMIGVLSNENDKTVEFYSTKGKYKTGDSVFVENTRHHFPENRTVKILKTKTLDSALEDLNVKHHHVDFVKLDVQGSEKCILEGAPKVLKTAEFVLMEVQMLEYNIGAPKVAEMISFMDGLGYEISDILGLYYLPECNLLNQADVLFVKKDSKLIPRSDLK